MQVHISPLGGSFAYVYQCVRWDSNRQHLDYYLCALQTELLSTSVNALPIIFNVPHLAMVGQRGEAPPTLPSCFCPLVIFTCSTYMLDHHPYENLGSTPAQPTLILLCPTHTPKWGTISYMANVMNEAICVVKVLAGLR